MDLSILWQRFLETVKDPAADPRSAVVLIAIALLTFLIIGLVVFILLPEDKEDDIEEWGTPEPPAPAPKQRSTVLLVVSLLLVALVLAGFGYGDRRSRQVSTCRSCHVLQPMVETWEASTHSKVGCIPCHESPGALGGVETRVRALSDLIGNLAVPAALRSPATVNQENCIACHEKVLSGVMTVGKLRIRHLDFVDRVACSQCHGRVGHDPKGAKSSALSFSGIMTTCADCHDGKTASRDCSTCHLGDISQAGAGPKEYARIDISAPTTCKGCHSLDSCTACHGIVMPHPPGWRDAKMHARAGAFDTTVCVRCHDAGCSPCHGGIHTGHGPDWKTRHQTGQDTTFCTRCHDANAVGTDMCRLCHGPGTSK